MSAEIRQASVNSWPWPCGPECRHAQVMPGTYGEWLWCTHPANDRHVARAGLECLSYHPNTRIPAEFSTRHWQG
ncbi:MAG: hypothetical protein FJ399_16355 [Verrucomicrobia bacterium]|nr:hypothetical protein [Verrucomicrobiota bacterium]